MAIRIDLPELGDGQYVDIRDPKFMTWGVQKRIAAAYKSNDIEANLTVAELVTLGLIKGGYVLTEDGTPFVFPITEENIKDIPAIVIEKAAEKFAELKSGGTDRKNS